MFAAGLAEEILHRRPGRELQNLARYERLHQELGAFAGPRHLGRETTRRMDKRLLTLFGGDMDKTPAFARKGRGPDKDRSPQSAHFHRRIVDAPVVACPVLQGATPCECLSP